jgi:hypothetical protein
LVEQNPNNARRCAIRAKEPGHNWVIWEGPARQAGPRRPDQTGDPWEKNEAWGRLPKHRPSLHSPAPDGLRRAGRAGGGGTIEQPPQLPWPLRYFVDEGGHETGFAMLRGTVGPGAVGAFDQMAATRRMIGFTHLGPFPLLHEGYGSGIAPGPSGRARRGRTASGNPTGTCHPTAREC